MARNFPKVITLPTDCPFSGSRRFSRGLKSAQYGIRLAAARQRRLDHLPGRRHDPPVDPGDRDLVSRLDDGVRRFPVQLGVGLLEARDLLTLFDAWTVIDEVLDRNALRQLLQTANVIDVIVGHEHIVDLCQRGPRRSTAMIRSVSRPPGLPVSMSRDSPDGTRTGWPCRPRCRRHRCRASWVGSGGACAKGLPSACQSDENPERSAHHVLRRVPERSCIQAGSPELTSLAILP